ncbi:TIGR00180 family glycosyltransferase [Candidatus Pelagibacter sp.]|nr:TIGR00180 family glycosyltransferase [Candidatus Pelagibacter sp.]
MNLTIIIPSFKRLKEFETLLRYYDRFDFKGQILIGEGSTKSTFLKKKKIVKKYKNLDVTYFYLKGRVFETLSAAKKHVKYDYVILTGDDDYLYIRNLGKLINYLKKNKSYAGVFGKTISIEVDKKNILGFSNYRNFSNHEETSIKRLEKHLEKHVVTLFAIQRKNFFLKMLEYCPKKKDRNKCPDRTISEEYLPSFILPIFGKFGILDCFYLYRVVGHARLQPTKYFNTRKSIKSIDYLEKQLIKVLKNNDNNLVKELLRNFFINKDSTKKRNDKKNNSLINKSKFYVKKFIKKIFPKLVEFYLLRKSYQKKYFQINYFKKNILL